ncbi:MAG: CO dehydrogenase/acetyl-CoA synthase complex subunit epsilon [Halobacteriota archaeon]|nr:CO dehydrogenase/acetyl-CoA synthase complex subunit epsilon [Halobacteriota archaeon]
MKCNGCSPSDFISFDVGNVHGPESGRIASSEVIGGLIKSAKRPLLVIGAEILEGEMIDKAIGIGKKGIPIAATGHSIAGLVDKGYEGEHYYYELHELTNCLLDPEWQGLDGNGNYDVVIFLGITYYYASAMLSALKNFGTDPLIRAVSIDRYYHPHARMTFKNFTPKYDDEYMEMLDRIISVL